MFKILLRLTSGIVNSRALVWLDPSETMTSNILY